MNKPLPGSVRTSPPELPVTADRPAIQPTRIKRPFGVRLWLALMFSAVGILTGTSVYIFVSGSSENAAQSRTADLAAGRTQRLQAAVEADLPSGLLTPGSAPTKLLGKSQPSENFRAWIYRTPAGATRRSSSLPRPSPTST